jgi:hypothetical protein
MGKKIELPVTDGGGIGRRRVLQGLFAGAGASLVLPGGVEAHTMEPAFAAAVAKAKTPAAKPVFLDEHQFATLGVLCTRIVPGSEKTLTDLFIDELLAVTQPDRQRRFLGALGAIDGAAIARFQKPFKALTEAQQVEILEAASTAEPGQEDWVWTPGSLLLKPDTSSETLTLRDHFDHVKGWISTAYYSSEAGLKEIGYTGQMFFQTFPDCTHPEHS